MIGFDGFSNSSKNYYMENYTKESGKSVSVETVKNILSTSFGGVKINFITPSLYEN
jgi:hypothetical protein